jgi:hypothetical protein
MILSQCSLVAVGVARYPLPFLEGEATLEPLHVEQAHDIKTADFVVLEKFQQAVPCSGRIPCQQRNRQHLEQGFTSPLRRAYCGIATRLTRVILLFP